ncbi:hypothetical protein ACIHEJ_02685 [Streptomyces sp. NPDC052301]|uniref:hypothetical protein n=1 Tax=Streptomyces sp. NPDC052301 TaxID=3365687 RepID=UPI0037CD493E
MSVASAPGRAWLSEQDCDLDTFRALVTRPTDLAGHPHADSVTEGVLGYDGERLRTAADQHAVRAELVRAFPVLLRRRAEGAPGAWLENALDEGWTPGRLRAELRAGAERRES